MQIISKRTISAPSGRDFTVSGGRACGTRGWTVPPFSRHHAPGARWSTPISRRWHFV